MSILDFRFYTVAVLISTGACVLLAGDSHASPRRLFEGLKDTTRSLTGITDRGNSSDTSHWTRRVAAVWCGRGDFAVSDFVDDGCARAFVDCGSARLPNTENSCVTLFTMFSVPHIGA